MEDNSNRLDADSGLEEQTESETFTVPSPEQVEAAEKLIVQANVARIQGNKIVATRLLREAADLAIGSSQVQEALGDAFLQDRSIRNARDCYKKAFEIDPRNISAERKYGEAVLAIQLAIDPNFGQTPADDSFASGRVILILSFLIPGLGQLSLGETKLGSGLLASWLIGIIVALAIPQGMAGLASLVSKHGPPLNPMIFLPLGVSTLAWIWSLADAGSRAKTTKPKIVHHPAPLVDKDF